MTPFRKTLLATVALALLPLFLLPGCGGSDGTASSDASGATDPAGTTTYAYGNGDVAIQTTTVMSTLTTPWGMAFLPDGTMLITERTTGLVKHVDTAGTLLQTAAFAAPGLILGDAQGLLDITLDPAFATNHWVYIAYTESGTDAQNRAFVGAAVARAEWTGTAFTNITRIYQQQQPEPPVSGDTQFGSRLTFARDGSLFITLGEMHMDVPASPGTAATTRFAQDVTQHLGKIIRINKDGSVPANNPDFGPTAAKGLWAIGFRNPQGAALHPVTGALWVSDHGPQGGDEINLIHAGGNYGWPLVSYGCQYGVEPVGDTCRVGGGVHAPTYVEPVSYWPAATSSAPAGITFVTSAKYPEWQNNLLVTTLTGTKDPLTGQSYVGLSLWRIVLNQSTEVRREQLLANLNERLRDVRQGPDGEIYLLTDSGKLLRITR